MGSPDVLINARAALRVNDSGVHAACCGPNTWLATAGAPTVLINGRPAHRLGDATVHCGGGGTLVSGSPDVIIGDEPFQGTALPPPQDLYDQAFVVRCQSTGTPLADVPYRITRDDGAIIEGRTDASGHTVVVQSRRPELLHFELLFTESSDG
jgi:uncharacterized Zn-binding protein involved in type VI secretion